MIGHQLALIRREIWEHRSIYITPAAIALIVFLGTLATLMFASGLGQHLEAAIFATENLAGPVERRAALTAHFLGFSWLFMFAVAILIVFYCLDCLYAERKDKSILFWRSLPVTDVETVLSKLLTAIVVIPLVTVGAIIVTHFVSLVVISLWVSAKGGDATLLVWQSVPVFDNWGATLIVTLAATLWMSPFVGWFLLVSAYTKRMPMLMAFMPFIVIPLVEFIFLRTRYFVDIVFLRRDDMPLFSGPDLEDLLESGPEGLTEEAISLFARLDIVQFVTSPPLWAGIFVCGMLTTAAIYVRRYRDDS